LISSQQETFEMLQQIFGKLPGSAESATLAAVLGGGDLMFAEPASGALRRVSVLVEVADTVTRRLSLEIQVKGKSRPTWVYESLGHHTAETFPKLGPVAIAYEAGLDCYQRRDWKGALGHFGEALDLAPHDRPSRIFLDRCRYYQQNPPADSWNGVWVMEQK
jgi:hypothetical protein